MERTASAPRARGRPGGFTLVETAIGLAVLSLVLGLAVQGAGQWSASLQVADQASVLAAALHRARNEAVKRNTRIAACKSADGIACATAGGWEQGLIVFEDRNRNAVREPGEEILHRDQRWPAGILASGNQPVRNHVSYGPTGLARMENGAFQAGTLTVCRRSDGPGEARQIVINSAGRPRVQKVAVDSCG